MPISLSKIAIKFKIENKGFFPYSIVIVSDSNISLDNRCTIPAYKYFNHNKNFIWRLI
jgi:hypothetical protein